ncbi:MAG TPA: ABC-F family ATP-binding cassette domain-containing protein [Bacteroidia bacterium]|nr:ABC-F family ATP-binding cassette domain-containing protein [Bacteroidia bacterium]HQF27424.1 ABC-F family ATP-binding cassette domain-containing protein [Bacteroidia bacterium]
MNIFTAEGLTKSYNEKPLFTGIDISLSEGQKMALIAANGSGKTTLLRILAGRDTADAGKVSYRSDLRIGYLEQDPYFTPGASILDCIFEPGHPILHAIGEYERLLEMGEDVDHVALQDVMNTLDSLNGWDYEARAAEVLGRLGIHDMDKKVSEMSGGQKKRIALARLLIEDHELLLLDEPTNHLDLDMIEWLENFLRRQNKSILLISHDRYFLDGVCNTITELEDGKIFTYNGGYAYYLERKEEREAQERSTIDKARNTYRKELEWMRRQPKARTTKSKSRQESFYDVEEVAKGKKSEAKMQITMQMNRLGSKILELENVCKSFDNKLLMENFSYTFKRGEKIGLIGRNGAGKSTLLNIIMELVKPDKGRVKSGETVVYGYYSQQGMNLPEDKRVIDVVKDIAEYVETGSGNWIGVSQFLNHFRFTGAKQHVYVSKLSGGEKKRLYLLTILLKNPNFLILDEPTNDLDIVTLNILEEFLEGYQGCMLMVTHDRYFMDRLVDHVFVLDGTGVVKDIHGNYTDYRSIFDQSGKKQEIPKQIEEKVVVKQEAPAKKKTKLSFKEQHELDTIEKELVKLEEEKKKLVERMNDTSLSHDELAKAAIDYQKTEEKIDEKTMRWLELQE